MVVYTPMIEQYLSIKADYPDAFLFFRLGDFYEMFFSDAEEAARILEITLTSRDGGAEIKIPMCGVPHHASEGYISKLIENGYKVAICDQVEDPKLAKGVVKREVVRVITPGTVMEGKLLENNANNYLAAVFYSNEQEKFGLAVADVSTGEFYATELVGGISNVTNELSQYQPAEIIVVDSLDKLYHEELGQLKAVITIIDREQFSDEELKTSTLEQFNYSQSSEISSAVLLSTGILLKYIRRTQLKDLEHFNDLRIYDARQFMVIDPFSKRNLELTHTSRELAKKGSLLWLLDNTATSMGSRLLRRWLEKPLLSAKQIEARLNCVEELNSNPLLFSDLQGQLKQIYDIERLVSKISFGNANPRDLDNLRKSLEQIPELSLLLRTSNSASLRALFEDLDLCQDVAAIITEAIQEEPPISLKNGGIIKRGYDQQLDTYYLATTDGKQWLYSLEQRERMLTGIKSLKVGYNKVFGYYIEITKANLEQVPLERYIRKQTLANAERYITEELKDQESIILDAEENMLELEYQIFAAVREKISAHNYRLQILAQRIAELDVLSAFSEVSTKYRYVKPTINQEGIISIEAGRHPVIEAVHQDKPFIPNDVFLDQNSEQILLITGPNMAGKSTFMRQIALTVIMAQIGCFVPAKSANIAITDRVFTRIGAGDDLTSGQSTFMVEMLETKQAITEATPHSLILLDEIGRGTSTYDGMALAQAIIQYIHQTVRAKTLFSTHYHELTCLAEQFTRIHNVHVNVIEKDGAVIFLHKIEKGKADRSYGIHVAELAGMPSEVINNAKSLLMELETKAYQQDQSQLRLDLFADNKTNSSAQVKEPPKSAELSSLNKQLIKRIIDLDLLNMTPMEGFQLLYDIQKQLRK